MDKEKRDLQQDSKEAINDISEKIAENTEVADNIESVIGKVKKDTITQTENISDNQGEDKTDGKNEEINEKAVENNADKIDDGKIENIEKVDNTDDSNAEINAEAEKSDVEIKTKSEEKTETVKQEDLAKEETVKSAQKEEIKKEEVVEKDKIEINNFETMETKAENKPEVSDTVEVSTSEGSKQNFWQKLSSKAKAAIIGSGIVVIIALVLTITFVTLGRFNIKVKTAEDFISGKHADKAYTYVIKGDINADELTLNNGNSLDLNKNVLTIKGIFTQKADGEWVINYGDAKGSNSAKYSYENGGLIKAGDFNFDSSKSVLNVYSDMQINNDITINANVVNIYGKITGKNINIVAQEIVMHKGSEMNADNVVINGSYLVVDGKTAIKDTLTLNNVTAKDDKVSIINSEINKLRLNDSQITVSDTAKVDSIELTGGSTLIIAVNVGSSVEGVDVENVLNLTKVIAKGEITIPKINNINNLTYDFGTVIGLRTNVDNVVCVKRLETPQSITIDEKNGKFYCHISAVIDASAYVYLLNDEVFSETSGCIAELPLSKFLKPGKHSVEAYATGKDIKEDGITYRFIDSGKASTLHVMTYTLSAPDVKISPEGSKEVKLSFNKVDFADYYIVTINGKDYKEVPPAGQETINIDITDRINLGHNNAIEVVAYSNQPDSFIKSDKTLLSYLGTVKLATPVIVMEKSINPDTVKISWKYIENAVSYGIFIGDSDIPAVVTNGNSYTFAISQIKDKDSFSVKALKNNYYKGSDKSNTIIYEVIKLIVPEIVSANNAGIEFKGVENATGYTVYVNDVMVTTITESELDTYTYNFAEELSVNDVIKVTAFNPSKHYDNSNASVTYTVIEETEPETQP